MMQPSRLAPYPQFCSELAIEVGKSSLSSYTSSPPPFSCIGAFDCANHLFPHIESSSLYPALPRQGGWQALCEPQIWKGHTWPQHAATQGRNSHRRGMRWRRILRAVSIQTMCWCLHPEGLRQGVRALRCAPRLLVRSTGSTDGQIVEACFGRNRCFIANMLCTARYGRGTKIRERAASLHGLARVRQIRITCREGGRLRAHLPPSRLRRPCVPF
jgi:hypothetical protein